MITVTGEHQPWGDASWRITPPFQARSGSVRVHILEVEGSWALKLDSPDMDSDVTLQIDSQQSGVFAYDLGQFDGWQGQEAFELKLFATGEGARVVIESIAVELRADDPDVGLATSVQSAWYPYQLTFESTYDDGNVALSGTDAFHDEHTIVRYLDIENPSEQPVIARFQGVPYADSWRMNLQSGALEFEAGDYVYVLYFAKPRNDGKGYEVVTTDHETVAWQWRCDTALSPGSHRLALIASFAPRQDGMDVARHRALSALSTGNFSEHVALQKATWDDYLAAAPAPMRFGIAGVDPKGVTPENHRRAYYAAWTFVIQNVLPPMPENDFPFPQSPTGKPSLWAYGASKALASAA